jgi:hypothetical protein
VVGRPDRLDHGAPSTLDMNQRYLGVFGQDSWRVAERVRFSFRHRAATGLGLDGNYTISRCEADTYYSGGFFNFDDGYQHPDDPSFDRGNCVHNRTQIANVSLTYQTPQFATPVLRARVGLAGCRHSERSYFGGSTLIDPEGPTPAI